MGLYTRFASSLVFPLHELAKGHDTLRRRRALEASQWLGADALARLQAERLRRFMTDIGSHVPYYRALLAQAGLAGADIRTPADLQRLPFLTKDLIRHNSEALKSERAGPLVRSNTGGSSGEPLVFYMGSERVSHDVAAKWRATRWWGVDIGDPEIVLWGSPVELGAQDRVREWRDRLLRSRLLPAFEMSAANLDRFVETILRYRPRMLFGYPSALALIAQHALRAQQRLDRAGIEVAFVTSERLYDDQRSAIERAFGCPVANGYGGRDAGFIAHQCPQGGMHLSAEDIIVEIVDAEGRVLPPGEVGEVVVTHLASRSFPFVRYRTGDMAAIGAAPCSCGRGLPVLSEIHGRHTDFVVAADGTIMHGLALIYVVRDLPGIRSFRIDQESLARTRLRLVTEAGFEPASEDRIRRGFKARLGEDTEVAIEYVDDIPRERSGKFRYVTSAVWTDRQRASQA